MVIMYLPCLTLSFGLTGGQKTSSEGEGGAAQPQDSAMLGSQGMRHGSGPWGQLSHVPGSLISGSQGVPPAPQAP